MSNQTESLPVVTQTATPQAPAVDPATLTLVLPAIVRKARVRRGPRTS
jgi:hypothetical protein